MYPEPDEGLGGLYLRGSIALGAFAAVDIVCECTASPVETFKIGYGVGGGIGYDFGGGFRVEAAVDYLQYNKITAKNGSYANLRSTIVLAKAYYDFDEIGGMDGYGKGSPLTPYVGFGLGAALTNAKFYTSCDCLQAQGDTYSVAATATAGLAYDLGNGITTDLGYELLYINKAKGQAVTGGYWMAANHIYAHQIKASLRVAFN